MHEEKHNNHINGALIIIATVLVGALLWYAIATSGDTYTATPVDVETGAMNNMESLYRNDQYGFSLRYDKRFVLAQIQKDDTHRYSGLDVGEKLLVLGIPREMFPNTNFSEGIVSVWVSKETSAVKNCLIPSEEEKESESSINPALKVFTSSGAGAGNFYELESYRAIHNGSCIVLDKMIHSTNIGNYDESMHVTEFDRSAVNAILNRVIESFHFN